MVLSPAQPSRKKSKTRASIANEEKSSDGGLIFITGEKPADFKSKKNSMCTSIQITISTATNIEPHHLVTTVRKKAMDAFLKGDRKTSTGPRSYTDMSRLNTVPSSSDVWSQTGIDPDDSSTVLSTIPTTASEHSESIYQPTKNPRETPFIETEDDQQSPRKCVLVVNQQRPRDFILPAAPIVVPIRQGIPLPYDEYVPQPFVSIGKSIDPFRTMFQAQHPGVSVEELKFHCSRYFGTRSLGRYWIPTALSHPHTFLGTLCLATAYHDVMNELSLESVQTIALRQEVIHLVGRNMQIPEVSVSDHNIMAVIQLIISEFIGREESGLTWHERGLETMVEQRGGLAQLGVHGRLASSITWVSLANAVIREEPPRTIYLEYGTANSTKHYQPTATIPESPVYCPRSSFNTVHGSQRCTSKAKELLSDIRMMIDIFLHETKSTRRNSQTLMNLYNKVTSTEEYPTVIEIRRRQVLTEHDWKYEAIRIASAIQATAIILRIPLSDALSHAAEPRKYSTASNEPPSDALYASPSEHDNHTEDIISPSLSVYSTNPAIAQSYFPNTGHRSQTPSSSAQRPLSSTTTTAMSSTPDQPFFPPTPTQLPNNTTTLLQKLRTAIEHSNMSECWSDMAGVLLWVCITVGAASKNSESKVLKRYFSALTMRAGIMLCFEHPEAINATMLRMCEIVEALAADNRVELGSDDGKAKKRRM